MLPTEAKTHSQKKKRNANNCIRSPCSRIGLVTDRSNLPNKKSFGGSKCPREIHTTLVREFCVALRSHRCALVETSSTLERTRLAKDVCATRCCCLPVFVMGTTNEFAKPPLRMSVMFWLFVVPERNPKICFGFLIAQLYNR